MKRTIRRGVFETNSSSVHSIVIGNNGENVYDCLPTQQSFKGGDFGWEVENYNDADSKASYLWTAIVTLYDIDTNEYREKIANILNKWGIETYFEDPKVVDENDYIDHVSDLLDFVITVCNDEDLLMNWLYSDGSELGTGNDSGYDGEDEGDVKLPKNVMLEYCKAN